MPMLMEHVIFNYIKIIYLCEDSKGKAIGDIPGGPFCFESNDCIAVKDSITCWSDWINLDSMKVRFEGAKVAGKLRTISFHAEGINCATDPTELYEAITNLLSKLCGENVKP